MSDCLPRYSYPWYIRFFCYSLSILFLYVTIVFFFTEFKHHCILKHKLLKAETCFSDKDFVHAIQMFNDLLVQYETCSRARERIIQSSFALAGDNPEFFEYGLSFFEKRKFSNKEISAFADYLSTEEQKNSFRSLFIEA